MKKTIIISFLLVLIISGCGSDPSTPTGTPTTSTPSDTFIKSDGLKKIELSRNDQTITTTVPSEMKKIADVINAQEPKELHQYEQRDGYIYTINIYYTDGSQAGMIISDVIFRGTSVYSIKNKLKIYEVLYDVFDDHD